MIPDTDHHHKPQPLIARQIDSTRCRLTAATREIMTATGQFPMSLDSRLLTA